LETFNGSGRRVVAIGEPITLFAATRTVSTRPEAINRNITGSKIHAQAKPSPLPLRVVTSSVPKKSARPPASGAAIPDLIKAIVDRVIGKINELAGTSFKTDSKMVRAGLVRRLKAGATEADCLAVVDNRWREWGDDPKMRQYFNPETLFRETNFEKYLNAARQDLGETQHEEWRRRTFYNA
jgi:uncharacterized phage protein (TIGR02220 family)